MSRTGLLDTSTVILLPRLESFESLPEQPRISSLAGGTPETQVTKPYGCSVKY